MIPPHEESALAIPLSLLRPREGFTLLELMITIVVGGILMAIAMPAFNSFVQNDRDSTQINTLVSSFNYARSEAVRRNTSAGVEVCPSGGGNICNRGAAWSQGIVARLTPARRVLQLPGLIGRQC